MSLLGRTLYQIRHHFRHGLIGSWRRDQLLPGALDLPPLRDLHDDHAEIHALTSAGDWLCLAWTLYSFYIFSGRRYRLCIHDDGSLPPAAFAGLGKLFPDARLIRRVEADARMDVALSGLPACQAVRKRLPLCLKSFDFFAHAESNRLVFLDCDVLFFASPEALIRRIDDRDYAKTCFNRDWRYGYTVPQENWTALVPFDVVPLISTGLGLMQRRAVDFARMEEWLGLPGMQSHPHRVEQTLLGLAASADGYEMLPAEYDVHLGPTPLAHPSRHYSGPARPLFFSEGLVRLRSMPRA